MSNKILYPAVLIAMLAFVFLIKLMYDMSVQMTRMTDQVVTMNSHMQRMGEDMRGMRTSVDRMSMAFQKGSQQMEQLNPMDMMQGVMPRGRQ